MFIHKPQSILLLFTSRCRTELATTTNHTLWHTELVPWKERAVTFFAFLCEMTVWAPPGLLGGEMEEQEEEEKMRGEEIREWPLLFCFLNLVHHKSYVNTNNDDDNNNK